MEIPIQFVKPEDVGLPQRLIHLNKWDFNPRAGSAYKLSEPSRPVVVRGGYGIYGYPMPLRDFNARMRQNPPTTARFTHSLADSAQTPDRLPSYGLRSVPATIAGVNSREALDIGRPGGISRGNFLVSYFKPHQPTSRAHEWNLTFEREILDDTVVRAGYVGTHGSRLPRFRDHHVRRYRGVSEEYQKTGWSNSQNFQFEIQRRYSKGYGFQFFYVMSNTLKAGGSGWEDDNLTSPNVCAAALVARFFLAHRADLLTHPCWT